MIGLNASVDRTLVVPDMRLGAVLRVVDEVQTAGGKGVNVARCLRQIGLPVRLVTLTGGDTGRWVAGEVQALGVDLVAVPTRQSTRTCDVVLDPAGGHPTVLNSAGPALDAAEWRDLDDAVRSIMAALSPDDVVVATGSLPPGVPVDAYAGWIEGARAAGAAVLVDAAGEALRRAVDGRPDLVKVNAQELRAAFGAQAAIADLAADVRRRGVDQVVVTDGARGAEAWGRDWHLVVGALEGPVVNPVGCGDAFAAGLAAAKAEGQSPAAGLAAATACAAANLGQRTPGLGGDVDVRAWAERASVRALRP